MNSETHIDTIIEAFNIMNCFNKLGLVICGVMVAMMLMIISYYFCHTFGKMLIEIVKEVRDGKSIR